jgi:hypothetical protein
LNGLTVARRDALYIPSLWKSAMPLLPLTTIVGGVTPFTNSNGEPRRQFSAASHGLPL